MARERSGYDSKYPLTGAYSTRGFAANNRHFTSPEDWPSVSQRRDLARKLGLMCERAAMLIWSSELTISDPNSSALESAALVVSRKIYDGVVNRRARKNAEVAPIYQAVTRPAEIPFDDTSRANPTWAPLGVLFKTADRVFGTPLSHTFTTLGSDPSDKEIVDDKIKFLVEGALILARVATEPSPLPKGRVVRNVMVRGENGSLVAQFDGIIVPSKYEHSNDKFDFNEFLKSGLPWVIVSIKTPFRNSWTANQRKNTGPTPVDIREIQNQCLEIALINPEFYLPKMAILIHLRGTLPSSVGYIHLDKAFIDSWADIVLENIERGDITELKDATIFSKAFDVLNFLWKEKTKQEDKIQELRKGKRREPKTAKQKPLPGFSVSKKNSRR